MLKCYNRRSPRPISPPSAAEVSTAPQRQAQAQREQAPNPPAHSTPPSHPPPPPPPRNSPNLTQPAAQQQPDFNNPDMFEKDPEPEGIVSKMSNTVGYLVNVIRPKSKVGTSSKDSQQPQQATEMTEMPTSSKVPQTDEEQIEQGAGGGQKPAVRGHLKEAAEKSAAPNQIQEVSHAAKTAQVVVSKYISRKVKNLSLFNSLDSFIRKTEKKSVHTVPFPHQNPPIWFQMDLPETSGHSPVLHQPRDNLDPIYIEPGPANTSQAGVDNAPQDPLHDSLPAPTTNAPTVPISTATATVATGVRSGRGKGQPKTSKAAASGLHQRPQTRSMSGLTSVAQSVTNRLSKRPSSTKCSKK